MVDRVREAELSYLKRVSRKGLSESARARLDVREQELSRPSYSGGMNLQFELKDESGKVVAQATTKETLERLAQKRSARTVRRFQDPTGRRIGPTKERAEDISRGATARQAITGVSTAKDIYTSDTVIRRSPESQEGASVNYTSDTVIRRSPESQEGASVKSPASKVADRGTPGIRPAGRVSDKMLSDRQRAILSQGEKNPLLREVERPATTPIRSTFKSDFYSIAGQRERFVAAFTAPTKIFQALTKTGPFRQGTSGKSAIAPEIRGSAPGEILESTLGTPKRAAITIATAPFSFGKVRAAAKGATMTGRIAESVISPATKSKIFKNTLRLGGGFIAGERVATGTVSFAGRTAQGNEGELYRAGAFKGALSVGREAEREVIAKGGIRIPGTQKSISLAGITNEVIPGSPEILAKSKFLRETFPSLNRAAAASQARRDAFRQQALARGLRGRDVEDFVRLGERQAKAEVVGSFAGQSIFSGGIELVGRQVFANRLLGSTVDRNKAFRKVAKKVFLPLMGFGTLEGAGQEFIVQRARGDTRPKSTRAFEIITGGLFGAVSAPLLGSPIAAASATNRKGTAFVLQRLGDVIDPTEPVGDILASGATRVAGRYRRVTPLGVGSVTRGDVISFGVSGRAGTINPNVASRTSTRTNVRLPTSINTLFNTPIPVDQNTPIPVNQKTPVTIESDPRIIVPTGVNQQAPTNNPTQVFSDVNINVTNPVSLFTPVPVSTVQSTFPLPVPPLFPSGTGRGGGSGRRGRVYVRELEVGQQFARKILGTGIFGESQVPKTFKNGKKRKRSKK